MQYCRFYIIISKKSDEIKNGLKKFTLGCENRADANGFIWIDLEENIQRLQLVFGEVVLEWFCGKWKKYSMSGRREEFSEKNRKREGSYILCLTESNIKNNDEILDQAINAKYPSKWANKIMEKF